MLKTVIQRNSKVSDRKIPNFWEESILIPYSDVNISREHIQRYQHVSRYCKNTDIILDLGAGSCYGSALLKNDTNAKDYVISLDLNKNFLHYGRLFYDVTSVNADVRYLPFREKIFDSIVALEVIEHLNDQKSFLRNIKHCMNDKGRLFISTPNKLFSSPFLTKPLNPYHHKEYYLGELIRLINSNGFKIVNIYGGRLTSKLSFIKNLIQAWLYSLYQNYSTKILYRVFCKLFNVLSAKSIRQHREINFASLNNIHINLDEASNLLRHTYYVCHVTN